MTTFFIIVAVLMLIGLGRALDGQSAVQADDFDLDAPEAETAPQTPAAPTSSKRTQEAEVSMPRPDPFEYTDEFEQRGWIHHEDC